MRFDILGASSIILGTCVGTGIIALPLVSSGYTNIEVFLILLLGWFVSCIGSLCMAELCFYAPQKANIITFSKYGCNWFGQLVILLLYLFIIYISIAAYLSGLGEVFFKVSGSSDGFKNQFIIMCGISFFVHILLSLKKSFIEAASLFFSFIMLAVIANILFGFNNYDTGLFQADNYKNSSFYFIAVIAFSYTIVVPSIVNLLDYRKKDVHKAIYTGSILSFTLFIFWIMFIRNIVANANIDLYKISISDHPNYNLINLVGTLSNNKTIFFSFDLLITTIILTTLIGVSLATKDFFNDLLKSNNFLSIYFLTFAPPLVLLFFTPNLFILSVSITGVIACFLYFITPLFILFKLKSKNIQPMVIYNHSRDNLI